MERTQPQRVDVRAEREPLAAREEPPLGARVLDPVAAREPLDARARRRDVVPLALALGAHGRGYELEELAALAARVEPAPPVGARRGPLDGLAMTRRVSGGLRRNPPPCALRRQTAARNRSPLSPASTRHQ